MELGTSESLLPAALVSPTQAFFLGQEPANSSHQSSGDGVAMQLCLLW